MSYEFVDVRNISTAQDYIYLVPSRPNDENSITVIHDGNVIALVDVFNQTHSLFWGKNGRFLGRYSSLGEVKRAIIAILETK